MPIELPAQIRIEFDPPSPSTSLITSEELNHQEAESKFAEPEVPVIEVRSPSPRQISSTSPVDDQTTSSASQGFLSIDSGVRLRSSSQDSHHSVPKSWSDFESEAKKWKPVKVAAPKERESSKTRSQDSEPEMSQSSEGYRSSAEIDQEVEKIVADTFKIPLRQGIETIEKEEKPERKIIERPRRNIDDFVRSAISLSDNCTKLVTERKKDRIPSIPTAESKIPRCTSDSGHSDSSLRAEPQRVEKIIRVKLIQSGDKLTYGYLPSEDENAEMFDSSKSISAGSTLSTEQGLKSAARQATVKRRDTFTRNFDKLEKNALQGVEKIYQAHQSRAQQLLIDLQISMAKNGYGKYRPQPIRNSRASDSLLISEV
ncbi:Oidioi.mRNA.OKI2018_I69.PAR.g11437.t1.cds [Oikopleura dioica]|uniref:Oidioi.mRNA.OKI2018_I69.PAR.g11437.t1.cds n=1 Tax=Oikopleura dioica TaxID=34765 RepID=A0ABN7RZ06_OIKDI|nr:Oidioi.mRNA.OKI2018_I69.PAR.g11437.t1.cds [Oikopleura dioica]